MGQYLYLAGFVVVVVVGTLVMLYGGGIDSIRAYRAVKPPQRYPAYRSVGEYIAELPPERQQAIQVEAQRMIGEVVVLQGDEIIHIPQSDADRHAR